MKEIFYNNDNLVKEDIDETVIRAKAIIINDNNEILLGNYMNSYQFPGGHLKEGETLEEGFRREILEETGNLLDDVNEPFLVIRYYNKNYRDSGKNRENLIYYYKISSDIEPNYEKMDLDEKERLYDYHLERIKLDEVMDKLDETIDLNPINKILYKEIKTVLKEINC